MGARVSSLAGGGTAAGYHGMWRAALLAAGRPGGRPPLELPLNDRVEAAQRMHAAGVRTGVIADELGVGAETVGRYLRASYCDCARNWMIKGPRCTECAREDAVRTAAARRPRWDRHGVIEALKRWAALEGQAPSSEAWLGGRHAHGRCARVPAQHVSGQRPLRVVEQWAACRAAQDHARVRRLDPRAAVGRPAS